MGFSKAFSICLISSMALMLSACGSSGDGPDEVKNNVPVYHYDDANRAAEEARNWTVNCDDASECPNTVGQLIIRSDSSLGVCTATLIGNDIAVANSHCFNFDDGDPNRLCRTGTAIVFASNSQGGKEIAECESVLIKSKIAREEDHNFRNPDYLIIKLKKPLNRGFEIVDRQGMPDGLKLTVKKVNPVGRGYGRLQVAHCEVVHGTFLMPGSQNNISPIHVMKGCEIIPGNSGSSLFDDSGKIRGLAFASISDERTSEVRDAKASQLLSQARRYKPSIATNAACVDWSQNGNLPIQCSKGLSENDQKPTTTSDLEAQVTAEIAKFNGDANYGYRFQVREDRIEGKLISYRPYCVKDLSKVPQNEASLRMRAAQLKLTPEINDRLRLALRVDLIGKTCEYMRSNRSRDSLQVLSGDADCIERAASSYRSFGSTLFGGESETWTQCKE